MNKYNAINQPRLVESYYYLIRNLTDDEKIELIARISNSMMQDRKKKKEEKTKEEILVETYGSFVSEKTADELIDEIYNSRHFVEKNYQL
jgi:hypothetical protein